MKVSVRGANSTIFRKHLKWAAEFYGSKLMSKRMIDSLSITVILKENLDDGNDGICSYEHHDDGIRYFEIEIDKSKMLFLNSKDETDAFAEKYLGLYYNIPYINWKMVAQDYGGIEIGDDGLWGHFTHTWDIPSGCLWGENMILKVKKL
jgi:hypothetical protein